MPALVYSATNPEDVDTTQEDHAYDECRYVLMANPISPRETKPVPLRPQDDPLDLIKERLTETFGKKFSQEMIDANLSSVERAYEEVSVA